MRRPASSVSARGAFGDREGRLEPEGGALAELAVDPDHALHGASDQALDHGEAEARAAVFDRVRRVGVAELLEHAFARIGGHARAGVADREAQCGLGLLLRHAGDGDQHAPRLGELHRIAGEVEQDLAQPPVVGEDVGHVVFHHPGDVEPALVGLGAEQLGHSLDELLDGDRRRLQLHLPGLDAREVQEVVDQPQQVFGGVPRGAQIGPLGAVEARAREQPEHADHPVQGVRISWLIKRRNSLSPSDARRRRWTWRLPGRRTRSACHANC